MASDSSASDFPAPLDVASLRQRLETLAKAEGVGRWDLGAGCSTDTSVQVDRGDAKQMKGAQRSAITLRVWNGAGLVGITSTSDLSDSGLARAMAGARAASDFGNPDDVPAFSPLATAPLPPLDQPLQEPLSILSLLDTLKEAEAELLQRHPAIATVPYNGLSQRSSERIYINSDGACRHQELTTASLYLYARAEEAGRKPRSSGAMRVAYGAFSSLFNARAVLDGVSLSKRESLGQRLAVPFLSIRDNGLHPGNVGAARFDGEGTPSQCLPLVSEGLLVNFLHSEATARSFGVAPTGHAGLGAKVSVGPDWFEIGPSAGVSGGAEGLDHRTGTGPGVGGEGLVVIDSLSALHAGVKASQGSFSLPFDGWWIHGGESRSIEAATVAGDIRTVLNSLVGFEGIAKVTPGGLCPWVWVEGLSVTGEA